MLGNYNYKLGGHLILWDLRLVIEFPPGCSILIPSAILRHSNTTIAANERRYLLTQYTAGGIFQWVERGFKPEGAMNDKEKIVEAEARKTRYKEGLDKFSMLEDLRKHYNVS